MQGGKSPTDPLVPLHRRLRSPALCLGLIGGAIWFYEDVVEERWMAPQFGTVEAGQIYRSGQLPAPIVDGFLDRLQIHRIINLTAEVAEDPKQQAQSLAVERLGIDESRFSMGGDGVIHGQDALTVQRYADAVAALVQARDRGQVTLVHCQAGTQRTGGVIAAYRLLVEGKTPREAYDEALQYDWDPHEDVHWPQFLNRQMGAIASSLVDHGVIAAVPDPLPVFAPW